MLAILFQMHAEYMHRLNRFADIVATDEVSARQEWMKEEVEELKKDDLHMEQGCVKAKKQFKSRSNIAKTMQNTLKSLCWSVHEHEVMEEHVTEAISTLNSFDDQLTKVSS